MKIVEHKYNSGPYPLNKMMEIIKTHTSTLCIRISYVGIQELANRSKGNQEAAFYYIKCIHSKMLEEDVEIATLYLIRNMFKNIGVVRNSPNKEKKTVTSIFQRSTKSKKPNTSSLKILREKIDQINRGLYV